MKGHSPKRRNISLLIYHEAIAHLIKTVDQLKILLIKTESHNIEKRMPIGIDEACRIIQEAKSTIYSLARKGLIPCYKKGEKLFFFEDELINWIQKGKKKGLDQIREEMSNSIYRYGNKKCHRHHRILS
ncbi:helix-turn-helix domain-containing protein [Dysgonomonas termitidis]